MSAQLPKSGLMDASQLVVDITEISKKYLAALKKELNVAHLSQKDIMYFSNNVGISSNNGLEMSFTVDGDIDEKANWMISLFKESGAENIIGKVFRKDQIYDI